MKKQIIAVLASIGSCIVMSKPEQEIPQGFSPALQIYTKLMELRTGTANLKGVCQAVIARLETHQKMVSEALKKDETLLAEEELKQAEALFEHYAKVFMNSDQLPQKKESLLAKL